MKDIEITEVKVTEVARDTHRTYYMPVYWLNGYECFGIPTPNKIDAERQFLNCTHDEMRILKFTLELPTLNTEEK
jgi:hypothetical protein